MNFVFADNINTRAVP